MIELKYHWIIFIPIAIMLLYLAIKKYKSDAGNFTPDTSFLNNLLYTILLFVFILIWGGFFWW